MQLGFRGPPEAARLTIGVILLASVACGSLLEQSNKHSAAGDLALRLGQYDEALAQYEESLRLRRRAGSRVMVALSYIEMGDLYRHTKAYPEALRQYREALDVLADNDDRKGYHERAATTGIAYKRIAGVFTLRGDFDSALAFYKKKLRAEDPDDPETITSYSDIASLHADNGRHAGAITWLRKTLAAQQRIHGRRHASLTLTYARIGAQYSKQNNYPKALSAYRLALAMDDLSRQEDVALAGNNDRDLYRAGVLTEIGRTHFRMGEIDTAVGWYQKAILIRERIMDPKDPELIDGYKTLALIHQVRGSTDDARAWCAKALVHQRDEQAHDGSQPDQNLAECARVPAETDRLAADRGLGEDGDPRADSTAQSRTATGKGGTASPPSLSKQAEEPE